MIAYIITEEDFDRDLLQATLPAELINEVGIVSGGGNYASLARSLIVRRKVPVALVLDADCVSEKLLAERQQGVDDLLRMVAGNTPTKVVLVVPEVENLLFTEVSVLSRLLGYDPPQEILASAEYRPEKALQTLLAHSKLVHDKFDLLKRLTEEDLKILQKSSPMQELIRFLRGIRQEKQAA